MLREKIIHVDDSIRIFHIYIQPCDDYVEQFWKRNVRETFRKVILINGNALNEQI